MAQLQKIIKVTQEQYNTLKSGGTVGSYSGIDPNYIYLVEDDGNNISNEVFAKTATIEGALTVWSEGDDFPGAEEIPTFNNDERFAHNDLDATYYSTGIVVHDNDYDYHYSYAFPKASGTLALQEDCLPITGGELTGNLTLKGTGSNGPTDLIIDNPAYASHITWNMSSGGHHGKVTLQPSTIISPTLTDVFSLSLPNISGTLVAMDTNGDVSITNNLDCGGIITVQGQHVLTGTFDSTSGVLTLSMLSNATQASINVNEDIY